MKRWTIYCHEHTESGRRYIGMTSRTMERRWSQHIIQARSIKNNRSHFANAICKYGKDAFSHIVLAMSWDLEGANETELILIEQEDTRNPQHGFNLAKGGGVKPLTWSDVRGRHRTALSSPEYRMRLSTSMSAIMSLPANRMRLANYMVGRSLSQESRNKIRDANLNRVISDETRKKLSEAGRGRKRSSESIAKTAAAHRALPKKTHCKHGHPLHNAFVRYNGDRICRICSRDRKRRLPKAFIPRNVVPQLQIAMELI